MGGKWLEPLSEIAPGLKRAAIMFNPEAVTASTFMTSVEAAARSLKVELITAPVHSDVKDDTGAVSGLNMMAARLSPGAISESSSSHLPPRLRSPSDVPSI